VVWRPAFWRQTVFDHQRRLHHSWPPWATNASIPHRSRAFAHVWRVHGAVTRRVPDLRLASWAERASDNSDWPNAERGEQHPRRAQAAHVHNAYRSAEIDHETYAVRADQLLTCEPPPACPWRSATSCSEVPCYPHPVTLRAPSNVYI
jgi:hypothetical protein